MQSFDQLRPEMSAEQEITVEERLTVSHTGAPVLSTPMMISLMERVAMTLAQKYLPDGFTTVGFEVHVKHRAPAPMGSVIKVWCKLTGVEGRKLLYQVGVVAGDKVIGEGTHRRTVIPVSG